MPFSENLFKADKSKIEKKAFVAPHFLSKLSQSGNLYF